MELPEKCLQNLRNKWPTHPVPKQRYYLKCDCFPLIVSAAARGVLPVDREVRPCALRDPPDPLGERVDDAAGPLQVGVAAGLQAGLAPPAQGLGAQPRRRLVSE